MFFGMMTEYYAFLRMRTAKTESLLLWVHSDNTCNFLMSIDGEHKNFVFNTPEEALARLSELEFEPFSSYELSEAEQQAVLAKEAAFLEEILNESLEGVFPESSLKEIDYLSLINTSIENILEAD